MRLSIIWFSLILILLASLTRSVHATPGCHCELEPSTVYLDGHQYRSLEPHLCGKMTFRIVSGDYQAATGTFRLNHLLLQQKRLFVVERLTVEVLGVDTEQERLRRSPRLYRHLSGQASALVVQPDFDEDEELSRQIARNLRRLRGPDDTVYEGYFLASLVETHPADGSEEPTAEIRVILRCRPHAGTVCQRCHCTPLAGRTVRPCSDEEPEAISYHGCGH